MKTIIQIIFLAYMLLKLTSLVNCTQHLITYSLTYKLSEITRIKEQDINSTLDIFPVFPVWVAFLEIGSPSQSVTLLYDLETKNTLIESSLCNNCAGFGFDATKSSSYKSNNNISQNFGRYHIYEYGTDLIKIDGYNVSHLFGLVDSINKTLKTDIVVTSIFGLGYEKNCSSENCTTFYSSLMSQGLIANKMFSYLMVPQYIREFCANDFCPKFINNGGIITFGGYDNNIIMDDIIWAPLIDQGGLWKININGIGMSYGDNTPNIRLNNMIQAAVLSSSNPQMVFSVEFANNVTKFVGGKFDPQYGYVGPCSSTIFGWVMIGEEPFLINPFDYMYAIPIQNGSTTCYAGFTDTNITQLPYWILGIPFMSENYVIFDIENAKVGFAHTLWGIDKF